MPQMAPYNWLILFFLFNMIMTLMFMINHYNMNKFPNNSLFLNFKMNKFIWMW